MKINLTILVFVLLILLSSCEKQKEIRFYQGQYFKKNQEIELNIDKGKYLYQKKFKTKYMGATPKLLKIYKTDKEFVNMYLRVGIKDTLITISSSTKKILFGNDIDGDLFIYTEKEKKAWLND